MKDSNDTPPVVRPPPEAYLNKWIEDLNRRLGKPTYDGAPPDIKDFLRCL